MPMLTSSEVSFAKTTLAYPIYAAEFDPYDRGYLIVGGGGGAGRSGIPNQITVLDVSNRATITKAVDIDLSRDEDSVSSLASLATKDGLIAFAGINSSPADLDASNNEHFRAFNIRYPPRKRQKTTTEEKVKDEEGAIELLGKRSLFKSPLGPKKETYQRLLRLSPARRQATASKRIGAIASGLARDSEVIVFDATTSIPEPSDVITKITLPAKSEATDLDIALTEESEFSITYCDDYNIYEQTISYDFEKKKSDKRPPGPRRVHQMPFPDAFEDPKTRPKFRCLRFLNAENILALINKPNKSGSELRVYHLYPTGPAIQTKQIKLPYHIRQATGLDVCVLDQDEEGNHQVVVAVAGHDISIEIFTTNFQAATDTFSAFKNYSTFKQVHQQQMTRICFSTFHSPVRAPDLVEGVETNDASSSSEKPVPAHPGPQYIKLASVSYGNTIVVDTFPLSPIAPKDKSSRYALSHASDDNFWRAAYITVFSVMVLVTAFLLQAFMTGYAGTDVGPLAMLPHGVKEFLHLPLGLTQTHTTTVTHVVQVSRADPDASTIVAPTPSASLDPSPTLSAPSDPPPPAVPSSSPPPNLRDALSSHAAAQPSSSPDTPPTGAVVVHNTPSDQAPMYAVHADKDDALVEHPHLKPWHDLSDAQQGYWKNKLKAAGHWSEHEGETVLKGVLWSTYAGLAGQVAGEILREL